MDVYLTFFEASFNFLKHFKSINKHPKMLKINEIWENQVKKWFSKPNKEKRTYKHKCAFIHMAFARPYPLDSLLNLSEQFFHPLPKELDHFGLVY